MSRSSRGRDKNLDVKLEVICVIKKMRLRLFVCRRERSREDRTSSKLLLKERNSQVFY